MKIKLSQQYLFIILVVVLSYTVSQLEFPLKKIPPKDEPVEFPFKTFSVDYEFSDMKTNRTTNSTLIEMSESREELYTITIKLGTPEKKFEVFVDTGSFVLWVPSSECIGCGYPSNKFFARQTNSLIKIYKRYDNLPYFRNKISGEVCYEDVTIGNTINLEKFKFLLVDRMQSYSKADGMLGLNRIYNDKFDSDFSLIESLFREGKIKQRIFSQKIDGPYDSKLLIGELPKEISEDLKKFTKCKTSDDPRVKDKWACNLKQILIVRKTVKGLLSIFQNNIPEFRVLGVPKPAIFDTGANVIVAPVLYFDIFREMFFKEMIEEGSCFMLYDRTVFRGFECTSDAKLEDLPELRFVFDNGFTYKINIKDFFKRNYDKYLFRIIFGDFVGDVWLLGQPFLKQYHMVFDMDDLTVGMYPLKNKGSVTNSIKSLSEFESVIDDTIDEDAANIHLYLAVLGCVLVIFSLILFILVRKYKKSLITGNHNTEVESDRTVNLVNTQ